MNKLQSIEETYGKDFGMNTKEEVEEYFIEDEALLKIIQ